MIHYLIKKKKIIKKKLKIQKINKEDACHLISEHYIFRIILISNILNMFKKSKKGYYNQCYSYFKSLTKGQFCIPDINISNIKNINDINTNKLIKLIFKDVKELSNDLNKCKGISINLTKSEINKYIKQKNKYTKAYKVNLTDLSKIYKKNLKKILKLLEKLEKKDLLTNIELNKIALNYISIIKQLNINCQTYYLAAIIAFIHLKLKKDSLNK